MSYEITKNGVYVKQSTLPVEESGKPIIHKGLICFPLPILPSLMCPTLALKCKTLVLVHRLNERYVLKLVMKVTHYTHHSFSISENQPFVEYISCLSEHGRLKMSYSCASPFIVCASKGRNSNKTN